MRKKKTPFSKFPSLNKRWMWIGIPALVVIMLLMYVQFRNMSWPFIISSAVAEEDCDTLAVVEEFTELPSQFPEKEGDVRETEQQMTEAHHAIEEPISADQVEQKPEFPGGEKAMYMWLAENIVFPSSASGIQDESMRVVVEFVVEKDGALTNVKITKPRFPPLDKEIVRVIKAMPNWIPGRNKGKVVRVLYTLPISFELQ